MKKADMMIILMVLIVAVGFYGFNEWSKHNSSGPKEVIIKIENQVYASHLLDLTLDKTYDIQTELGRNVVVIHEGEVWIEEADCPDDTCVRDGHISDAGEILVCLPHRVVIEITGQKKGEVDVISH